MIARHITCRWLPSKLFYLLAWIAATTGAAAAAPPAAPWTMSGDTFEVCFDGDNGSIVSVKAGRASDSIFHSHQAGLWSARFQDGSELHAAEFAATQDAALRFRAEQPTRDCLCCQYASDQLDVTVTIDRQGDGLQFGATVQPRRGTVLQFALPGRLAFSAAPLERFICPADSNRSVGTAFLPDFFDEQPADSAARWQPERIGAQGYNTLFGGYLPTAPQLEPPVALSVTAAGRACFGGPLADRLEATPTTVNRPGDSARADLVLIDSPNGPYFYSTRLNNGGRLWRIGGRVEPNQDQRRNALWIVGMTLEQLVRKNGAPKKSKIGLVGLQPGPDRGSWTDLTVADWADALGKLPIVNSGKAELVRLTSPAALDAALAADGFLAIVNPYGERLPMSANQEYDTQIEAIRRYVAAGGNWFETGGYPFFEALRPVAHHYRYEVDYPPAFADFFHWQTTIGTASLYRVAPRTWEPWAAASDHSAIWTTWIAFRSPR